MLVKNDTKNRIVLTLSNCFSTMSGFPPKKWEARFLQDMDTLQCSQKEGETLSMEAYVAVKPSGGQEGNF